MKTAIDMSNLVDEDEGTRKKGRGVTISDRGRGKSVSLPDNVHAKLNEVAASQGISPSDVIKNTLMHTKEETGDVVKAAREQERVEYFESKGAEHKTERLRRLKDIRDLEKRLESGENITSEDMQRILSPRQGGGDEEIDKWINRIIRLRGAAAFDAAAGGGSNKGSGESDTLTTQLMNTLLGKIIDNQFGSGGTSGGGGGGMDADLNVLASEVARLHDIIASQSQTSPLAEIKDAMEKVIGFRTMLEEMKEKGESLGFMPKKLEEELDRRTLGKFGRFMGATKEFVDIADKAISVAKKAGGERSVVGDLSPPE